jgi:hypothetical protein
MTLQSGVSLVVRQINPILFPSLRVILKMWVARMLLTVFVAHIMKGVGGMNVLVRTISCFPLSKAH